MYELRGLKVALTAQRKRLEDLVELCGGEDPNHPLQKFSLQRISWLENRIAEMKEKTAQ